MRLIIGLGNPEVKHEQTRHNAGFLVLDELAEHTGVEFEEDAKFQAEIAELHHEGEKILLVKPLTYMNRSGEAVIKLVNYYDIENDDLLVIHDEIDLPFGKIRASENSGSAGHKGVESIIEKIGKDFLRIRVGVEGREEGSPIPTDAYVLQKFSETELKELSHDLVPETIKLIRDWLSDN